MMDRQTLARPCAAKAWLHVVAPLLAGGGLYLLWRSPQLRMFSWCHELGVAGGLSGVRSAVASVRPLLPDTVLFSAPDAAWTYAAVAAMRLVWQGSHGWWSTAWV